MKYDVKTPNSIVHCACMTYLRKIEIEKDQSQYGHEAWSVYHTVHDIEGTEPINYKTTFAGPDARERAQAYAKSIGE